MFFTHSFTDSQNSKADFKSTKAELSQHPSQHHAVPLTAQVCECLIIVNRILLDEERIMQLPAITYCLTCKYMLRQNNTAALCCNAVK